MKQPTTFEQFAENLYRENLRGAWELESMKYGIMARLGLDERDALELAVRIVAVPELEIQKNVSGQRHEQAHHTHPTKPQTFAVKQQCNSEKRCKT